ncbi:hypothetical protein N0V90_007994 [Kalmusia sp. IMI 367209]|nr:hypothetical protein N0V90_007994 [Kalmusia sp. IMI 367209]
MSTSQPQKVNFPSNGINIVGELYRPSPNATSRKNAAIAIGHPAFGVKEQTAANYARALSTSGFYALTFDAAYQGESDGSPRGIENPFQRAEDVRAAVSFLATLSEVDSERIGVLGICASGGYVPFAAQTDTRMKAVATVSAACLGSVLRDGLQPKGAITREQLAEQLKGANALRTLEAQDGEPRVVEFLPLERSAIPAGSPQLVTDGWDYYRTPRGAHPRSTGTWVARSMDLCANFDSYAFVDMISPRPLLMIAGSEADTKYFSERAVEKAREPSELFIVQGKKHIDLYDDLSVTEPKLVDFFEKYLAA